MSKMQESPHTRVWRVKSEEWSNGKLLFAE